MCVDKLQHCDHSLQTDTDGMRHHQNTLSVSLSVCPLFCGPSWESNPGPLAPEASIIPLDQTADARWNKTCIYKFYSKTSSSRAFRDALSGDLSAINQPTCRLEYPISNPYQFSDEYTIIWHIYIIIIIFILQ